jgi:hypothetical protein
VLDEVVRQIGQCQPRQTEITTVYHRHCYHLYAQIVAAGKQAGAFGGGFQQIAQVKGRRTVSPSQYSGAGPAAD